MFLSEILQQSLKLRADLPFTPKETVEEQDDKREGWSCVIFFLVS